jgi:hypothetical protein
LLYLYPADLRRRDGRDMERLFSDLVDAERHARRPIAASRAAVRMLRAAVVEVMWWRASVACRLDSYSTLRWTGGVNSDMSHNYRSFSCVCISPRPTRLPTQSSS